MGARTLQWAPEESFLPCSERELGMQGDVQLNALMIYQKAFQHCGLQFAQVQKRAEGIWGCFSSSSCKWSGLGWRKSLTFLRHSK